MRKSDEKTQSCFGNSTFEYFEKNGFQIRFGLAKDYNYSNDDSRFSKFELRIRNDDVELMEPLLQKIKEDIG